MTTAPNWQPVDNDTADLLTLVADTDHPSVAFEFADFLSVVRSVAAAHGGEVDQNHVRPQIRGRVAPKRIGSFYRRACLDGVLAVDGYSISDDHEGRNAGRPMRRYRWRGSP